jgi:hypothetical protein
MKFISLIFVLTFVLVIAQNKTTSRGKSPPTSKSQQKKSEDKAVGSKFVKWKVSSTIFN